MSKIRTCNVAHLEEENLKLFIKKCEKLWKIENVFGEKQEQVFRDYQDFYLVLNAICKLCKKAPVKSGNGIKLLPIDVSE